MLNVKVVGSGPPLVALHGLFGSLENIGGITRLLGEHFQVYSVDLPDHGKSPHVEQASLPLMADMVSEWMRASNLASAYLLGHSLGGKVAMEVALSHPELVSGLVVLDIAPVRYDSRHTNVFAGLQALDLKTIVSRADAESRLQAFVPEKAVSSFLLKNLVKMESGYRWRMNLKGLQQSYSKLIQANRDGEFAKPVLFVKGGNSDYIIPAYRAETQQRFPLASMKEVPGTGHWLHAEKPSLVAGVVHKFLMEDLQQKRDSAPVSA